MQPIGCTNQMTIENLYVIAVVRINRKEVWRIIRDGSAGRNRLLCANFANIVPNGKNIYDDTLSVCIRKNLTNKTICDFDLASVELTFMKQNNPNIWQNHYNQRENVEWFFFRKMLNLIYYSGVTDKSINKWTILSLIIHQSCLQE